MMSRARMAGLAAAVLSLTVLYAGLRWGALVAGGSDSYGYVSQAGLWQQGSVIVQEDVIGSTPWPLAAATWTPLGYRPSPHRPDAIVPLYAPGLPLLMALFQTMAGFCGAFVVVPLCGALTIWLTYALGRRLFDAPGVALWGAGLVATSPVFLYQLMNAMSDVPVTAAWTLALVLTVAKRPLAAGLAMSAAIAIRPNLVPLAIVPLAWMLFKARGTAEAVPYEAVGRCAIGLVPGIGGIAWFNARFYESPLTSGYGTLEHFYSLGFASTNVRQFATWMAEVETPMVALAGLYFVVPRLFPPARIAAARPLLAGWFAVVILSYLFFNPFDVWWYLRFLLPMWPVMMLLTAAALEGIARHVTRAGYLALMAALIPMIAWHGLTTAANRHVFDLGRGERRYVDVARFIASHTDPAAVVLSLQHSGSLRLYASRLTLRYDLLDPAWLDRTVAYLQSVGRRPYFVLDVGEVDAFRQRFGASSRLGALDWTPLATLGTSIAVYDPIDRQFGTSPLPIARTLRVRSGWLCDPPQNWPPLLRIK
jgi:hypothetical protein